MHRVLLPRLPDIRMVLHVRVLFCQLAGGCSVLMLQTVVHELEPEQEASPNVLDKHLSHIVPDIPCTQRESETQRKVAEQPAEILPEHTSEADHINEDAQDTTQSGKSKGNSLETRRHSSLY